MHGVPFDARSMDCLLRPRTIAVVGATEKVGPGRNTIFNLIRMNYTGTIYPINPKREEVFGVKCHKSLEALPETPELAVIALPAAQVIDILKDCARLNIKAVMVYTSGFAEAVDIDGTGVQEEMAEICRRAGIALCGPNCLGHLNVAEKTGAWSGSIPDGMKSGKIAVLSQSGSMAIAMLQTLLGLGISHVVSYGNQAVLELPDYLFHLSNDPSTQVIVTFIEGVKDGRRFLESARECRRRGKAVIALKTGKSEISRQAVSAHTAAIAGSDAVFDEALREAGLLRVEDLDEMVQTANLLANSRPVEKGGVMVTTISGGQVGMIGDTAEDIGLVFPDYASSTVERLKTIIPSYLRIANPIDVGRVGSDKYEEYADVLRICAEDPAAGLLLVSQDAPAGVGPSTIDHYQKVVRAVVEVAKEGRVPVAMFSNHSTPYCPEIVQGLFDAGVPYLQGTRASIRAAQHLIDCSLAPVEPPAPENPKLPFTWEQIGARLDELFEGRKFLGETEGKILLSMLGIPVAEQILCRDESEVSAAANKLGYPLVMKIESPDIAHKTEAGGVALNLDTAEKVKSAYAAMMQSVKKRCPDAHVDGVTLQKMCPDGVDLIVGMHKDSQFGPVLVYGLGGIYVEVFKDSAMGLVPVGRDKARAMIRKSKSHALLGEVRGRPALDSELLVDIIVRLSAFVERFGDRISAVDLNPVRIGTFGVAVLDALILPERGEGTK